MKKLGRPKKNSKNNNTFVGISMPRGLANNLSEAAAKAFRNRTQHILWI